MSQTSRFSRVFHHRKKIFFFFPKTVSVGRVARAEDRTWLNRLKWSKMWIFWLKNGEKSRQKQRSSGFCINMSWQKWKAWLGECRNNSDCRSLNHNFKLLGLRRVDRLLWEKHTKKYIKTQSHFLTSWKEASNRWLKVNFIDPSFFKVLVSCQLVLYYESGFTQLKRKICWNFFF